MRRIAIHVVAQTESSTIGKTLLLVRTKKNKSTQNVVVVVVLHHHRKVPSRFPISTYRLDYYSTFNSTQCYSFRLCTNPLYNWTGIFRLFCKTMVYKCCSCSSFFCFSTVFRHLPFYNIKCEHPHALPNAPSNILVLGNCDNTCKLHQENKKKITLVFVGDIHD